MPVCVDKQPDIYLAVYYNFFLEVLRPAYKYLNILNIMSQCWKSITRKTGFPISTVKPARAFSECKEEAN